MKSATQVSTKSTRALACEDYIARNKTAIKAYDRFLKKTIGLRSKRSLLTSVAKAYSDVDKLGLEFIVTKHESQVAARQYAVAARKGEDLRYYELLLKTQCHLLEKMAKIWDQHLAKIKREEQHVTFLHSRA